MAGNVLLFTGDDIAQIRDQAEAAATRLAGADADAFALEIVREKDGSTPASLLGEVLGGLATPSFFGTKTVWLKDFQAFDREPTKAESSSELAGFFLSLVSEIERGLPDGINLILSGPGCSKAKALYKAVEKSGKVFVSQQVKAEDKDFAERAGSLLRKAIAERQMRLEPQAAEALLAAIGTDTARISQELDKLWCRTNGGDVRAADVRAVCEATPALSAWAFRDALGARNLAAILKLIDDILSQEKDPESFVHLMLRQASDFFRDALRVRLYMHKHSLKNADNLKSHLDRLSDAQRKALGEEAAILGRHPYVVFLLGKMACNYEPNELVAALEKIMQAYRDLILLQVDNRTILERLAVQLVAKSA
ncbi:MAG: polymerase subunit delta [Verrucomicrobiota bacterium]|jgi:DNA polymerase III delta subunit